MPEQKPVPLHMQAKVDQEWAAVDDLVATVRQHRRQRCVHLAAPCISDQLLDHLVEQAPGRLLLLLSAALCRLADQTEPSTTAIEGIAT